MQSENVPRNMEQHGVDGLTIECENLMISLKQVPFNVFIMSHLLDELAEAGVNVDIITRTSPVENHFDVSLIVFEKDYEKVEAITEQFRKRHPGITILVNREITRLCLHGIGMRTQSGVAARYLQIFADLNIPVQMITTSEICIACVVKNEDAQQAVEAIRKTFGL